MLQRPALLAEVQRALFRSPAVALVGPRQVGKTTLARNPQVDGAEATWFDLEDPQVQRNVEAGGFTLQETGAEKTHRLWWRGGFPLSFTAASDDDSRGWRRHLIRTVVERDLPQLGMNVPARAIYRF